MTTQKLTYRFNLDTFKNGIQKILQGFQTGEDVSRHMEINLVCGSLAYEIPSSNITASMYVKRPSQSSPSINFCTIDAKNNKILYTVTADDVSEAGIVEMQLKLIDTREDDTVILVSPKFGMEVWESNIDDSGAEGTPTYTSLTQALADANAMKDSSIADLYIDENNVFTVKFGDGTEYTSDVIADAIARIDSVEFYSLKSEGYAIGKQKGADVTSESPYYENNSKYFSEVAEVASTSASTSATSAATSASNAATSASNASTSATSAATSASNASTSATSASASATSASTSETNASTSATNAATSESNALSYKNAAATSESNASASATSASTSASNASVSATNAATSESNALASATSAGAYRTLAESYAIGGTSARKGEDTDNCAYYKKRCEEIAGGLEGGILPMGTVDFASLPTILGTMKGWMYNVSDAFASDLRFKDGGSKQYAAGTNVYVTADLMWDCFSGDVPTVNGKTGHSITLDGADILVTGYNKAPGQSAITVFDSIDTALGKLEKKADDNNDNISDLTTKISNLQNRMATVESDKIEETDLLEGMEHVIKEVPKSIYKANSWNVNTSYDVGDIVLFSEIGARDDLTCYYIKCIQANIGISPETASGSSYWTRFSPLNETDKNVASINLKLTDNDFTITTTWLENTSIGDYTNYPYYQTISTDIFTDESHPDCLVFGVDTSAFMTETERDNKSYLCDEVQFTSTGITLLATDPTETALTLRVKGGISSSSPTPSDIQYFYNTDSSVPQCEWSGTPGYLSGTMDTASYYTVYSETGLTVKDEKYLVVERVTTDFVGTKNKIRILVGTSVRSSDIYTWEYKTAKSASNLILDISSYKGQTIYVQFIINLNAETDVTPSATLTFGNTYLSKGV